MMVDEDEPLRIEIELMLLQDVRAPIGDPLESENPELALSRRSGRYSRADLSPKVAQTTRRLKQ